MTATLANGSDAALARLSERFRLSRAGILNVWQYDEQEFRIAGGRMLLRGANGAGKSKTLEMLLPFVLDGDKARITASARHHTSLLWLMTDGYEGQARTGYLWVEFARPNGDGEETYTCGVGLRGSASARSATAWFFATSQRIGTELMLEDDGGPLSRPRLAEAIGDHGQVFEQARAYKEHVGRTLFGLDIAQYDNVLRLLYWLRQPQVGEDIEPARLASQLSQALPQLDEQTVRAAGDTFDELVAFGEQIDRRAAAAEALDALASAYRRYARGVVASRGAAVLEAVQEEKRLVTALRRLQRAYEQLVQERAQVAEGANDARDAEARDQSRIRELENSAEAGDQRRLAELADRAGDRQRAAEAASRRVEDLQAQLARREGQLAGEAGNLLGRLRQHFLRAREAGDQFQPLGVEALLGPPIAADIETLDAVGRAVQVGKALSDHTTGVDAAEAAVSMRQAAMRVVREAASRVDEAARTCRDEERQAAEAERRWDDSRQRTAEAQARADEQEEQLAQALRDWSALDAAPKLTLPEVLTPTVIDGLPSLARDAASPVLTALRADERQHALLRDAAQAELDELGARRLQIERERDPAPPAPPLTRSPRTDGAPFWQLVDFAPGMPEPDRAGLEAALQASGVLDAWVRPDGALLDHMSLDVVLPVGPAHDGPTLAEVLVPDCPAGSDVTHEVVAALLHRLGLGSEDAARPASQVGVDGSWALGPLRGRSTKAQAQYVGATARAAERRRRLDEVDHALHEARRRRDAAAAACAQLVVRIEAVDFWLEQIPTVTLLAEAWTRLEERSATAARDEAANAAAQRAAHEARQLVVVRRDELHRLANQHRLPMEGVALAAISEKLRHLAETLRRLHDELPGLVRDLDRWSRQRVDLDADLHALAAAREDGAASRRDAAAAAAAFEELEAAVGATVRDLQGRIRALKGSAAEHAAVAAAAASTLSDLDQRVGAARTSVGHGEESVAAHWLVRSAALGELAEMAEVPGLVPAAFPDGAAPSPAVLGQASRHDNSDLVPREISDAAALMARLADSREAVSANVVWQAYNDTTSGPAADHEPRMLETGELLAVTGRDEAGEDPIVVLASRVAAKVAQDRQLLTERERGQFEQHVLGELGDAIRRCRHEAEELVHAMNDLLAGVTTSQGIRVRLDWRLRDDVTADSRQAMQLLIQPVGALLPEERGALRDALHRLIEASRADSPELSYGENLATALDYRAWFGFRIRYTRPESAGTWHELHRRSPLSQGEQKVLCYLPLFAAAAAHFTSLAGAAPHAPRLVLLDDAFPKIDVRTHPLLFGLLVQLDLDFVITSERLWGDHDTVPSLAIYEALRDPSERGIAQYEYRWDGRQLRSIG